MYSGYPLLRSSGIDIFPTIFKVAAEDPETAANMVHPAIFVCSKPPGKNRIQGDSPRNISSDNLVRNSISPIQIKSGKAVRVQLLAPVQMVVIIASPAGRVVKSSIPTQATPISASPTQTELPRSRNKTNKKMIMA